MTSRSTSVALPRTQRIFNTRKGRVHLHWYMRPSDGLGAFWSCSGDTKEECERIEKAQADKIAAAYVSRKKGGPAPGRVKWLVHKYRTSSDYKGIADSTKRSWNPHFELILTRYGSCTLKQVQAKGFRSQVREFRDSMTETPRKADMFIQVFSRVLSWGVDMEHLDRNPITRMGKLSQTEQHAAQVWTPEELKRFFSDEEIPQHIRDTAELLLRTGARPVDARTLMWSHVKSDRIVKTSSKSVRRGKTPRPLVVEIDERLKALLERLPKTSTHVLTISTGSPRKNTDTLSQGIQRHAKRLGINKRTYDLRGSALTYDLANGMSITDAAIKYSWAETEVQKIYRTYCDAETVLQLRRAI